MKDLRLYSINAAAFVLATTDLEPEFKIDEESGQIYFQFPQCSGVNVAIWQYKGGNPTIEIHKFLDAIHVIRSGMKGRARNEQGITQAAVH